MLPRRFKLLTSAVFGLLSLLVVIGGCKSEDVVPATKPVAVAGVGIVSGVVKFDGSAPPAQSLGENQCGDAKKTIFDESLVVGPDGGVQNVVVYLENGPNVPTNPEPAVLDQTGCQYVPHVVAVRTGQKLKVTSSDATLHNAHKDRAATGGNKPFNLAFSDAGQTKEITFSRPEVAMRVRCDVHQWMNAYIAVFDHPFFAVTGEDGRFELKDVPPGTYTLVAWHERYGEKKQQIIVGEGSAAASSAEFKFGK